jgi:hypothetical protein
MLQRTACTATARTPAPAPSLRTPLWCSTIPRCRRSGTRPGSCGAHGTTSTRSPSHSGTHKRFPHYCTFCHIVVIQAFFVIFLDIQAFVTLFYSTFLYTLAFSTFLQNKLFCLIQVHTSVSHINVPYFSVHTSFCHILAIEAFLSYSWTY